MSTTKASDNRPVVIVTGSSSGIGASCAVACARLGARVVVCGRNEQRMREVAEECYRRSLKEGTVGTPRYSLDDTTHCVKGDVSSEVSVRNIVDSTVEKFGRIDSVVLCAGYAIPRGTEQTTVEDLRELWQLHVVSPFLMIKQALPHLVKAQNDDNDDDARQNNVKTTTENGCNDSSNDNDKFSDASSDPLSNETGDDVTNVEVKPTKTTLDSTSSSPARQSLAEFSQSAHSGNAYSETATAAYSHNASAAAKAATSSSASIIFISSLMGFHPMSFNAAYSVTKATQDQFVRLLSAELKAEQSRNPTGNYRTVAVNSVRPGWIRTPIIEHSGVIAGQYVGKLIFRIYDALTPVKRCGESDEVGEYVAFLAMSCYQEGQRKRCMINGQNLSIDGGSALPYSSYYPSCTIL